MRPGSSDLGDHEWLRGHGYDHGSWQAELNSSDDTSQTCIAAGGGVEVWAGVFWMPAEVGGYVVADSPRLEGARRLEVLELEEDPTGNRDQLCLYLTRDGVASSLTTQQPLKEQ